jgi:hypothetical protein
LGVLKGLIHRAHLLCDIKKDLIDELELLQDVFISNGYPPHIVQKTIRESWKSEFIKSFAENKDALAEDKYFDVIHAPYVQKFSENLQKDLNRIQIGFVMKQGRTLYSELCNLKQKTSSEEKKNVVYSIKCKTCDKEYIGETGQKFTQRKYQHQMDVKNGVATNGIFQHLKKNKGHKIDWDKTRFLDRESHFMRRKIKESVYINACDPSDKPVVLMNLEKGYKINTCWNEFNADIKVSMSKKK